MKSLAFAFAAATTVLAMPANAATIVNVSGVANASLTGGNATTVSLAAGTYSLSFIQDAFTAFNRFVSTTGCNAAGANCASGWENSVRYIINGVTYNFGDGNANGGVGPISGGGYYSTAAGSLAAAAQYATTFTLTAPGTVGFYIYDDQLSDNNGGVSLSIAPLAAAVPEPATWGLMILGFGAMGAVIRRKTRTAVTYA